MKIRSKLLYYYGFIIVALLLASAISISAVSGWSRAASRLSETHSKAGIAEKLRSNIFRQVNYSLDYLYGDIEAKDRFMEAHNETMSLLEGLKTDSLAEREQYFIEGFEETQFELIWIMNKFFESSREQIALNLPGARERLREMADEVADDVASLTQYYDSQENVWLKAATEAGGLAVAIIISASGAAVILFIVLAFFLQRWLVKPIATVDSATRSIRDGDLDSRIRLDGNDEWADLASAVNEMASSLKESLQKLSDQERLAALGEVSAYAAHNIRNPLAGIRAAVQVLLKGREFVSESAGESMEEIIRTVDRLDGWLKRLLEFARPMDFEPSEQDINKLLVEAVSIAGKPFENGSTRLNWRLAENIPPVTVDAILLEQALAAIATNAFQAVLGNGQIDLETLYDPGSDDGWLTISIADNGIGVPEHIKPRLFRIFESSKKKGTGLGLAQAKRIIDIHGGNIDLESETGKGTEVRIRLPLTYRGEGKGE